MRDNDMTQVRKQSNKSRQIVRILLSLLACLLSVAALSLSTYAWYGMMTKTADNVIITVDYAVTAALGEGAPQTALMSTGASASFDLPDGANTLSLTPAANTSTQKYAVVGFAILTFDFTDGNGAAQSVSYYKTLTRNTTSTVSFAVNGITDPHLTVQAHWGAPANFESVTASAMPDGLVLLPSASFETAAPLAAAQTEDGVILSDYYNHLAANSVEDATDDMYVTVGNYTAATVTKINANGTIRNAEDQSYLSVGQNAAILFNFFKHETNGDVKVFAPVLTLEAAGGSVEVIGDTLYLTTGGTTGMTLKSVHLQKAIDTQLTQNELGQYVYSKTAVGSEKYISFAFNELDETNTSSSTAVFTKKVNVGTLDGSNQVNQVGYGISTIDGPDALGTDMYGIGFYPAYGYTDPGLDLVTYYSVYVPGMGVGSVEIRILP